LYGEESDGKRTFIFSGCDVKETSHHDSQKTGKSGRENPENQELIGRENPGKSLKNICEKNPCI